MSKPFGIELTEWLVLAKLALVGDKKKLELWKTHLKELGVEVAAVHIVKAIGLGDGDEMEDVVEIVTSDGHQLLIKDWRKA